MALEYFDPESGKYKSWRESPQYKEVMRLRAEEAYAEKCRLEGLDKLAAVHNAKRRAAMARAKKLRIRGPLLTHNGVPWYYMCYDPAQPETKSHGWTPQEALAAHFELQESIRAWEDMQ